MNKRLITIGLAILAAAIFIKITFVLIKSIKVDAFHKAAITFIIDVSGSNKQKLPQEIRYVKSLCSLLDPEDSVKIIKSDSNSYLIYEGSAGDNSGIGNALKKYTPNGTDGDSTGDAMKKAVDYSLTMKKDGYNTAIVVLSDLERNGDSSKQINWDTLPENIEHTLKYLPELSIMFVYAEPEKLDYAKTKLNPVLGEDKLIIANEVNIDKANSRFLKAIGR